MVPSGPTAGDDSMLPPVVNGKGNRRVPSVWPDSETRPVSRRISQEAGERPNMGGQSFQPRPVENSVKL